MWHLSWMTTGLLLCKHSPLQQLCADFQVSSLLGSQMANKPYHVIWLWTEQIHAVLRARHNGSKKPTFLSPQFGWSFSCQGTAQLEPMNLRMFFVWKKACHLVVWWIWALWHLSSPSRPQYWSCCSWGDRSTQTSVWHMGQHSECSQPDGQYRCAWQDSGEEFTVKLTLPSLYHSWGLKPKTGLEFLLHFHFIPLCPSMSHIYLHSTNIKTNGRTLAVTARFAFQSWLVLQPLVKNLQLSCGWIVELSFLPCVAQCHWAQSSCSTASFSLTTCTCRVFTFPGLGFSVQLYSTILHSKPCRC